MAFINTIPASAATGEVAAMYTRQQQHYGYVPGYAKVFSHRPELMALWADLQRGIKRNMSRKMYELATVSAAIALRSTNCALAHTTALQEYFDDAQLLAIFEGKGVEQHILTAAEQAMMKFASKVALNAAAVEQADVDALRALGTSDEEIFDVAATAAARAFFTKVVDGLGGMADHDYPSLSPAIKEKLMCGRPLEVGEREVLPMG